MMTPSPAVLGKTKVCEIYGTVMEVDKLAESGGDMALPSGEARSLE